uniref:Uncharacterized protein n=1 Tax=Globodera rostochiensis TaxID=31243 RepID=A0A914H322_GLORO
MHDRLCMFLECLRGQHRAVSRTMQGRQTWQGTLLCTEPLDEILHQDDWKRKSQSSLEKKRPVQRSFWTPTDGR